MAGPKITKPKLDMNMSLLMLGLVILVLGNIYYTYRQYNELNSRITNINKQQVSNVNVEPNLDRENKVETDENIIPERKNIFINETDEQISENIKQDIEVVENELNNDLMENEITEMDINFKDMETDLSNEENNSSEIVNVLNDKSKKDLMEIAEENNLSKSGTKTDLINRLVDSGIEIE